MPTRRRVFRLLVSVALLVWPLWSEWRQRRQTADVDTSLE